MLLAHARLVLAEENGHGVGLGLGDRRRKRLTCIFVGMQLYRVEVWPQAAESDA